MPSSLLRVEQHTRTPLHVQIYERFKALIHQGRMSSGQRVPSLRNLAAELGIARGTVEAAYDRLIGEGYLVARGSSGTFVAEFGGLNRHPTRATSRPTAPPAPARRDTVIQPESGAPQLLHLGLPALDEFPRKLWARLVARQARGSHPLTMPQPQGLPRLREAIAAYLHRSRGIAAEAGQVYVVPGYAAAVSLVSDTLLKPGDEAWVESPGYPLTAQVLTQLGHPVRRVPVDYDGMRVDIAARRWPQASLAIVTPSHQSPTGVSLTLARRTALLDWADAAGAWILEDDYDSEYRYRGHPLPALKSLDRRERVVYFGTFSKVLYPGLRLAYLVVPDGKVPAFAATCQRAVHGGCPELLQAVVADFIEQGHFARHIKRMRTLYARRRSFLADALAPHAQRGLRVKLGDGGMHLLIQLHDELDDVTLEGRARAAGFAVHALSRWRQGGSGPRGLLAGFTNVTSAGAARKLVRELLRALDLPESV